MPSALPNRSGEAALTLPLPGSGFEFCQKAKAPWAQWTGFGPLQQFLIKFADEVAHEPQSRK